MKAVGIVAFAFGAPSTIRSNRRIGSLASEKAREFSAPVYTQRDVPIEADVAVTYAAELTHPPSTLKIARGALQWAEARGLNELLVVAAKPHLPRCGRDLAAVASGTGIQIRSCVEIEQFPESKWFCRDSTQHWVQSRGAWEQRERVIMLLPFFLYKFVAR